MPSGLHSGVSGIALGSGLYRNVSGLWSGASGFVTGFDGWTPLTLFAAGEQGYWLDPWDFSTMFQDTAGTTPVTAVGQSVRLMLDKSRGLTPGANALASLNFTDTTNWLVAAGGTLTRDNARSFTTTASGGLRRASVLTVGTWYQIRFDYSATAGFGVRNADSNINTVGSDVAAGSGTFTAFFSALTGSIYFRLAGAGSVTITDLAVRELPGNHFTQSSTSNAPILGRNPIVGTRNLLTFTEELVSGSSWGNALSGTGVAPTLTANVAADPTGMMTADRLQFSLGGGTASGDLTRRKQDYTTPATTHTFSIYLRSFDGSSTYNMHIVGPTGATTNIVVTGTWQRFTVTGTATGGNVSYAVGLRGGQTPANSNTADILAWGAQLEVGSTATAYQRVGSAFDVTQDGVQDCYYLAYDGTDDWLQSGTITPGTDKVQVFAGVRKLSDAAAGIVAEFNPSVATTNGGFALRAPTGTSPSYGFWSRGTAVAAADVLSGYIAPITNVLTGIGDIAADTAILRVNGAQSASASTDQGTGNYLAYPAYIGRRGGTSLPFNGRIYQLICRFGPNLTAAQIQQVETFVNSRTGAY